MSDEREVLNVPKMGGSQVIGISEARNIAANQEELSEAEEEAKFARVLERGIVIDRAHVDLPDDVYGEWVANDDADVARMQVLGFKVDDSYAIDRSLNSDGVGSPIIGDVIFMTCPQRTKTIIDRVRKKMYDRNNPKGSDQREERLFKSESELPVVGESSVASASGEEIEDIVSRALK